MSDGSRARKLAQVTTARNPGGARFWKASGWLPPLTFEQQGKKQMKLCVLPPSARAFKVIALKNYKDIECEIHLVDLGWRASLVQP
jgi:hypothetical protein